MEYRYNMPQYRPALFGPTTYGATAALPVDPINGHPVYPCQISSHPSDPPGQVPFMAEYNYGNSYYSFDTGLVHVIFLNPYVNCSVGSRQYRWLVNDLEVSSLQLDSLLTTSIHRIVNHHLFIFSSLCILFVCRHMFLCVTLACRRSPPPHTMDHRQRSHTLIRHQY